MLSIIKNTIGIFLVALIFSGCWSNKKLITDEVVFTNGNSQTGTILSVDTISLKLKHMDESVTVIPWSIIDTVQGKKLQAFWLGFNQGYYSAPYFSVFRNESIVAQGLGFQLKLGMALRGNKLYYFNFSHLPAKPYNMSKFGFGFQRYLGASSYIKKNGFFWGTELDFMNVKYNNGSQFTIEPFTGYERKLSERFRIHAKLGFQINVANKNNQMGVNLTVGVHFLRRNFKKYYHTLNSEKRIPRK